ncbi:MAG: hypothetical protein LUP97_00005 [Methanoregula sp.]|nr:hypothetical protein [Methanoregula sp.]
MGRSTFIVIALTLSLVCSGIPVSAAYETGPAGVTQGEVLMSGIGFFGGNTPTGNLLAGAGDGQGAVTLITGGDQSYYFGEDIRFSGTNTRSRTTYLFLTGPNLNPEGVQINGTEQRQKRVIDGDAATFQAADVRGDGSWSWTWRTKYNDLDAGTYTVYAASAPRNLTSCQDPRVSYSAVTVILKCPFVSGSVSPLTVVPGEPLDVSGAAEGNPGPGVAVWILGDEYFKRVVVPVTSNASYAFILTNETTRSLPEGEYNLIIQHPYRDDRFGVDLDPANPDYVLDLGVDPGHRVFKIQGRGCLTGNDAADALVGAFQSHSIDDRYTKLRFFVSGSGSVKPYNIKNGITIQPIVDQDPDNIVITATTNLPIGQEILVEVYSTSFVPTQRDQCLFGASGIVKVTRGKNGLNQTTVDLTSPFFHLPEDEYLVSEVGLSQDAEGSAIFNVRRP